MSEDDLKAVLAKYQQKAFDLFNRNIVLETQVETLTATVNNLSVELEKLRKPKRGTKVEEDF
jgi:cytochrome oxidase Cu insertion factor (SCO1/SenC/PrrC family)